MAVVWFRAGAGGNWHRRLSGEKKNMPGAGYDISASRSETDAFPQNSAAPTYIIFGSSNSLDTPFTQTNTPEQSATATAGAGGPTSGAAAAVSGAAGVPVVGTNETGSTTFLGISTSTWVLGIGSVLVSFLIAKHFSKHG